MARKKKEEVIEQKDMTKIDIGCGDNKREGYFGIDKFETASTDMVADLFKFPWPIDSDSVEDLHCSHFFEHVPKELRRPFIEEIHRVLKKGAKANFITPYGDRNLQDPTHEWPPVVPGSFLYYNQDWLKQNKLTHGDYVTTADFDFTYGYNMNPNLTARNQEYQQYALQFYNNAATDLFVTLIKK